MHGRKRIVVCGLWSFILMCLSLAGAQNWPSFRGERAVGAIEGAQLPASWDVETGKNVAWKISLPGLAHSSPIVWGDRIFLTNAVSSNPNTVLQFPLNGQPDMRTDVSRHQFRLMAIDTRTGKVIWDKLAYEGEPRVARHPHNSYAAATPATDGKHVAAFYGSEGLYAFSVDGEQLWKQDVGVLDQAAFDMPESTRLVSITTRGARVISRGVWVALPRRRRRRCPARRAPAPPAWRVRHRRAGFVRGSE